MTSGLIGLSSYALSTLQHSDTPNNTNTELKPEVKHYGAATTITTLPDPGANIGADGRRPAKSVTITTDGADDVIKITKDKNNDLFAEINGVSVKLDINETNQFGSQGTLFIDAGDGDNEVSIASDVKASVTIKTGNGADRVVTGGGFASVHLGAGRDNGVLGDGGGELYGEDDDDELFGGEGGSNHLHGGSGNNYLQSGRAGSRDQTTWIHAEGNEDKIVAYSTSTVNTKSEFTEITVEADVETYINIDESAGETITRAHVNDDKEPDNVTFTGRNEPPKDKFYPTRFLRS
ncbi:calcium-binding protein [Pseudomonas canadensis]|uniref:calcium-binding protein n=1 Tax=Pseudomonas canadensis TaxID=915099 RepID=UPI0030CB90A0